VTIVTKDRKLPMRILLVSSSSGSQGGGELYLDMLAEGLNGLGHVVQSLLSSHTRMDSLAEGLGRWGTVHRTALITNTYDRKFRSFASMMNSREVAALERLFHRFRPDVVHVNKQNVEDGLDLLLAAQQTSLPTVCTVHVTRGMTELGSAFGRARDLISRRILRKYRGEYITIANACRRQFTRFVGPTISDESIHAVANGIQKPGGEKRAKIRQEWGVASGDVVLGCVARIEAQKDPLFALELLSQCPANIHLAWVGDGRMRAEFEERAAELGLTKRVHLDGWRKDARERMHGLDVFLLPSLYEGLPFAVLEAMAAGLPSVVSDVDGVREAVVDGVTGWLCPPRQKEAWLARIGELATSFAVRKRMGMAAQQRAAESYSLESMSKGTVDVYQAAILRTSRQLEAVK
jgi:glycosyltransferase involved in cell wall biosynthesis